MAEEQAKALPATTVARAANGHLMEYEVIGRYPDGALMTRQYNARCVDTCGACAAGESLPDW